MEGRASIAAFNQQNEQAGKGKDKEQMASLSMDLIQFSNIKHKSKTLKETVRLIKTDYAGSGIVFQ